MVGGMEGDVLNESGIPVVLGAQGDPLVITRCKACRNLNDEDAKFSKNAEMPFSSRIHESYSTGIVTRVFTKSVASAVLVSSCEL